MGRRTAARKGVVQQIWRVQTIAPGQNVILGALKKQAAHIPNRGAPPRRSPAVEGGDEHDAVAVRKDGCVRAAQLPVRVVHEHENARAHARAVGVGSAARRRQKEVRARRVEAGISHKRRYERAHRRLVDAHPAEVPRAPKEDVQAAAEGDLHLHH